MKDTDTHHGEADRIALYLVGRPAGERERIIYSQAMDRLSLRMTEAEARLWSSMLRSRRRMARVDAGLALLRPTSVLRRKLLLMLAILETSPEFADSFLPGRCPPFKALGVAGAAVRGAFRGIAGVVLVKWAGL